MQPNSSHAASNVALTIIAGATTTRITGKGATGDSRPTPLPNPTMIRSKMPAMVTTKTKAKTKEKEKEKAKAKSSVSNKHSRRRQPRVKIWDDSSINKAKVKTQLCWYYQTEKGCERGKLCNFAHGLSELQKPNRTNHGNGNSNDNSGSKRKQGAPKVTVTGAVVNNSHIIIIENARTKPKKFVANRDAVRVHDISRQTNLRNFLNRGSSNTSATPATPAAVQSRRRSHDEDIISCSSDNINKNSNVDNPPPANNNNNNEPMPRLLQPPPGLITNPQQQRRAMMDVNDNNNNNSQHQADSAATHMMSVVNSEVVVDVHDDMGSEISLETLSSISHVDMCFLYNTIDCHASQHNEQPSSAYVPPHKRIRRN